MQEVILKILCNKQDLNIEKNTLKNLKSNQEELQSNELLAEQGEIEDNDNNFDRLNDSEQQSWLQIADKDEYSLANKEIKEHCGY